MKDVVFIILAFLCIGSAMYVAFSKNIVYSAFSLLVTLLCIACFYLMLGADFLAGIQLLIYVGGILVLIIFAVMLTRGIEKGKNTNPGRSPIIAIILGITFLGFWLHGIWNAKWLKGNEVYESTTALIGDALLTDFLLPFELISVLLLIGLVGAVSVARLSHLPKKEMLEDGEDSSK